MSLEQDLLRQYHTLVVVGLTSDPEKPAHWVSEYMIEQGYRIIPVNPTEENVLGLTTYPDLASIPEPVEFVDVFRRSEFCADIARQAAAVGAKVLWLQQGIVSAEARRIAEAAGITYVEDRCVLAEHRRGGIGRVAGNGERERI